ncbi:MAG: CHAT domain-containing protein [Nostoc sp.]|uniref:CHAT domain-containing protein n=1 Tax=Nostoc sp. TaxID=1180 RepID=UPI002FF61D0D
MNEQRLQAYYQLIKSLLNCPNGEEPGILAANTELLDTGFLQVLAAVAEHFAQQGDENRANWLRNLATQLTPKTSPITQEDIETYGQFLLEILQATAKSNGDAQVIYPLLAANTDKLNHIFAELLRRWATNTLAEAEPDTARSIAAVIVNFSNLIQQFPLGSKASNMEISIACYEIALTVYTRSAFPQNWATTQNNLGAAYGNRIFGERAENIELAIAAYSAALSVYTRSAFPQNWATTQNNLGEAYRNRIFGERAENIELAITAYSAALEVLTRSAFPEQWATLQNNLGNAYGNRIFGERAENIELAIAAYSAALSVYTRSAFPQDWAMTQNNLGNAYGDRIFGERAENIELAIAAYSAALEVRTRSAFPQDWAMTQNNLGNAYRNRIFGERAENIESAIAAYSAALSVYTRSAFPEQWATTQNNLATAYGDRIKGERVENIEFAIAAFSAALEVRTRSAFPQDWAMTQNNLGNAYRNRIFGERAENIESAIAAYSAALSVYTRSAFPEQWATTQNNLATAYGDRIKGERVENIEFAIAAFSAALEVRTRSAFPQDWAMTQNNLGNAYGDRIFGERAENIESAIAAYSAALEVRTRSAFPEQWATTQNNLATAYGDRIFGERAENIELAIAAYNQALSVRTRSAFPQNHAETLFNLGNLYQDTEQFDLAYNTFASAIATVKSLWGEIVSGDEAKHKQAEEWNQLYRRMVEVCLQLKRDTEAIEYIEQSKTRNLVELLAKNEQLAQIAKAPVGGEANLPSVDSSIRFAQIQNLLDNKTAIIQWYIFNDCFRAFIITSDNDQPAIWHSHEQDLENLINWTNEYLQLYGEDKKRWRYELSDQLTQLAQILHLNQIVSLVPCDCQKLILIPHLYLHLLPLHALPISASDSPAPEYLIDQFPEGVSYAPSCQLLRFAQLKMQKLDSSPEIPTNPAPSSLAGRVGVGLNLQLSHLFAIQNPTNDLIFTDIEVETIAKDFQPHQVLKHSQATKAALAESSINDNFLNAQWLHFSCHGYFDFNSPLKSGLQLADARILANTASSRYLRVDNETSIDLNQCLTLEDIFLLNLRNCRLVCLSACETGLVDISSNSDEYIGLASGFIRAGAANIISSLWAVSDFHTSLLMIKFYEILKTNPYNVALALNTAQQWLRQATQTQIIEWIQNKINIVTEQKQKIIDVLLQEYKPEQQPFKRPEFWAAFCAISPVYSVS